MFRTNLPFIETVHEDHLVCQGKLHSSLNDDRCFDQACFDDDNVGKQSRSFGNILCEV